MTVLQAMTTVFGALLLFIGGIVGDRRLRSGKIESSEAKDLWEAGRAFQSDLIAANDKLASTVEHLREEVATLQGTVYDLKSQLNAQKISLAENDRLQAENKSLRAENKSLRAEVAALLLKRPT